MAIFQTMPSSTWKVTGSKSIGRNIDYEWTYAFNKSGAVSYKRKDGTPGGNGRWKISEGKFRIKWNSGTSEVWDMPINSADWGGYVYWGEPGAKEAWLYAKTIYVEAGEGDKFIDKTVSGFDATYNQRLMNFASNSADIAQAHREYITSLVNMIRMNVVSEIYINGYAHQDREMGLARANAVSAELTRQASWLSPYISISYVNNAPIRSVKGGSDGYWRGVDLLVYMEKKSAPPPRTPYVDETPPMPGPKRYFNWEIAATVGLNFQIAPGAVLNFDHLIFRHDKGHWHHCVSIRVGLGQSVDIIKAMKCLSAIKAIGLNKFIQIGGALSSSTNLIPPSAWQKLKDIIETLLGPVSVNEPSWSEAPAVTPFCAQDLNGATVFIGSASANAGRVGWGVGGLGVSQQMPHYELKFIDTRTPPRWLMTSFKTSDLVAGVDVGGQSAGGGLAPGVSGQLAGGPLILL